LGANPCKPIPEKPTLVTVSANFTVRLAAAGKSEDVPSAFGESLASADTMPSRIRKRWHRAENELVKYWSVPCLARPLRVGSGKPNPGLSWGDGGAMVCGLR
jgi:hypothetical protein